LDDSLTPKITTSITDRFKDKHMRLLMIYAGKFGYTTALKTLDNIPDLSETKEYRDSLAGFIHSEAEDENNRNYIETKLVKNLKWAARKNETNRIVLHSFAHLAESKASPEFTAGLFNTVEERLTKAGYEVFQTPFGYFLDLNLQAPGHPLARLFKSF
jgi:hypothetical protein